MHFISRTIVATAVALTAFSAVAKPNEAAISQQLEKVGLTPSSIASSPIPGLNEVATERGVIYTTDDGKYFVVGHLYENSGAQPVNLTEQKMAKMNKDKIAAMEKDMIVYPAKNEKYVVTVFTDTSCGYCRKLHNEIKGYNDEGITVRYLAFPRGGERSGNFNQMSAIWGAKDRAKAMDDAKSGNFDESKITPRPDLVRAQYELGVAMGVNGTPAIVLADGTMIPGYQPPAALRQLLDSQPKS
ncbi:bifunctional protein-disulfide isomerase/oxidoreductase DsbC [Photobacterium leiognathi]|uniref:bifunctional protein-disulfide isomerase/oxidoreductase DsbC n=1 Tax=Photobacterium leiognathi TaxID=553611 RepID=UPI000D15B3AA|nr:bifunctional protein-disulfide isomerase/oxidoreductase DsbC [Photobacterium leiognathi]PSW42805.1 bifunctional protein-disulfide isomerase/oxidoreductase DsbC [Photobacterium leiognathi subsp. mandapamensis]